MVGTEIGLLSQVWDMFGSILWRFVCWKRVFLVTSASAKL